MTISGRIVHTQIKNKIKEAEIEYQKVDGTLNEGERKIQALTTEREKVFSSLAIHYLPDLEAKSLKSTLRELQQKVQEIFESKQKRRKALEDLMQVNKEQRSRISSGLEGINNQLETKAEERDELKLKITLELKANTEYIQQVNQLREGTLLTTKLTEMTATALKEAPRRLAEFMENKEFSYLLRREYGTPSQKGIRLTQILDDKVAKSINYEANKRAFDYWTRLPEGLKRRLEERSQELQTLASKKEEEENKTAERYGLPKVLEEGKAIGAKREESLSDVKKLDEQYTTYSSERHQMEGSKDSYHQKAIQELKSFLKDKSIKELKDRAQSTQGSEDDQLVNRIEDIDQNIKHLKKSINSWKEEQSEIGKRLEGLKRIETTYTSKDYESGRSYFPGNFEVEDLLTGYILGRYSASHVESTIERSQEFEGPSHSSHSSSNSSSDSGYSSGGGDDSSSSWSSGGGFSSSGGGDFSTGGGF